MSATPTLEYDQLPGVTPCYIRAVTHFGSGLADGATIPNIVARVQGLRVSLKNLARYRKVCGFARAESLPVTYPHVLAFPLQMAVLTHKDFPLRLLGLIHVRNAIKQDRAIAIDERVDVVVSVGGHRDAAKGVEFDLVTQILDAQGAVIWEETGTMLSRSHDKGKASGSTSGRPAEPELGFTPAEQAAWQVPADIGRRYATAAGDFNPIHLSRWSAKLFGFPRAIATGMWTTARAAAALQPYLSTNAYSFFVTFKKPVFLPSTVMFQHASHDDGADFALTSRDGEIHHLIGAVRYV